MTTQTDTTDTKMHTIAYARHVASKVAADLKRLQRFIGEDQPTDESINKFEKEAAILLYHGCLGEISYGYVREDGSWLYALKFWAVDIQLQEGDDPKGIGPQDIDETNFRSFLTYSARWQDLSEEQRNQIEQSSPIQRLSATAPHYNDRFTDRKYVTGHIGVQRFITN